MRIVKGERGTFCLLLVSTLLLACCSGAGCNAIQASTWKWVSFAGQVTSYGSESAFGWISILAEIEEWAEGWCALVTPALGEFKIMIYPPPTVNFTIYVVRLVNASSVKLNYDGSDFWVSGFWEYSSVTNPRTVRDILLLLENMTLTTGELNVTGTWTCFTLNAASLDLIQGDVTAYCIRTFDNPYEGIPYGDINYDYKVDIRDVANVAISFGSTFCFDRYQFCGDLNYDLIIDIRDLAACASNFGKVY